MAWFRNLSDCPQCGEGWSGEWSSTCDDDCPTCGARHVSPSEAEDLTLVTEPSGEGALVVRYSIPLAEDDPRYVDLVTTGHEEIAEAVMKAAMIVQAFR